MNVRRFVTSLGVAAAVAVGLVAIAAGAAGAVVDAHPMVAPASDGTRVMFEVVAPSPSSTGSLEPTTTPVVTPTHSGGALPTTGATPGHFVILLSAGLGAISVGSALIWFVMLRRRSAAG